MRLIYGMFVVVGLCLVFGGILEGRLQSIDTEYQEVLR